MTLNYFFRLVLVTGLFFPAFLQAERIFLVFDPVCMDRLEFQQNRPEGKSVYVVYHINVRSGEKLILEVGEEGANQQNYLPTPNLTCANASFDETFMRRINSNMDEVYIVLPVGDQRYNISRVRLASLYLKSGSMITYDSPKYRFRFDLNGGAIGENIALNNPGIKVYFEGRMENDCSGNYLFRQLAPQSAYPLIDLVLVPEIGIVEERSGANASAALNNMMSLATVNTKRADRYLLEVCGKEPGDRTAANAATTGNNPSFNTGAPATASPYNPTPSTQGQPAFGTGQPSFGNPPAQQTPAVSTQNPMVPASYSQTTPPTSVPAAVSGGAPTTNKAHVVQRGETLYGIASKNGVTVDQVKAWNGLTSNSIRSGQELIVSPPSDMAARSVSNYDQPQAGFTWSAPAAAGATLQAAPGVAAPTTNPDATLPAWKTTNGIHVVQAGETVASIAMLYGYTEARFRSINDLGPRDFIKVGQRMRTTDCPAVESVTPKGAVGTTTTTPAPTSSTSGRVLPTGYSSTPTTAQPSVSGGSPQFSSSTPSNYNTYTQPAASSAASPSTGTPTFSSIIPQAYETGAGANSSTANTGVRTIMPETTSSYGTPLGSSSGNYGNNNTYGAQPATTSGNYYDPYATQNQPATNGYQPSSYDFDSGAPASGAQQTYSPPPGSRRVHIVQEGESLYSIGQRYGIAVDRLRQLNNLGVGEVIMPYQRLFID